MPPKSKDSNYRLSYYQKTQLSNIRSKQQPSKMSEPRITRRMSKAKSSPECTEGKCVICLNNYLSQEGKLPCGHIFCLQCIQRWWRQHPNCPYCRQEILYIESKDRRIITFEELPIEQKVQKDEQFITHCELCWGQIEESEQMNICTICRGVYWHRRCLPFRSCKWYCLQCGGEGSQQGRHD